MSRWSDPTKRSAPLPDGVDVKQWPRRGELMFEVQRQTHELLYALHRQRTAWAKFARVSAELSERNIDFVDNERPFVLASGDVKWWRGEVSSRANALTALLAAVEYYDVQAS
jgi:hypothetical protein